ncbi:MAG: (2Fe-2S)-binding protein [Abitibacteriaceae bacterium]|nr:(2Fe-2S)-binding protein [Abditibacteriaceae bacterium]
MSRNIENDTDEASDTVASSGATVTDSLSTPTMSDSNSESKRSGTSLSRRDLLKIGGMAATAGAVPAAGMLLAKSSDAAPAKTPGLVGPSAVPVTLLINGKKETLSLEPRVTLLDALRNRLDLTGAKKVCDRGQCGACTVNVNGKNVMSCMTLAINVQNVPIQTIEGLAQGDHLHPVQEAFIAHDALMCGFCTPGFIMSLKALLDKNTHPTLDDVKEACQGNICRCGTYPRVFEAALAAAQEMRNQPAKKA